MGDRKFPRIKVEWVCSECDQVHRISFPYVMKSLLCGITVKWGKKENIKKLEIDYGTTLSDLNDFLTSVFEERYKATKYVELQYPKKLLSLLKKNEQIK